MVAQLIYLLEVRKMISLGIAGLFMALALMGRVDPKLVEYVVISVISFYFAKSTALDSPPAPEAIVKEAIAQITPENTSGE